jgi:hypothetical protein
MAPQADWLTPWKKKYVFRSSDDQKNKANKRKKLKELQEYLETALEEINEGTRGKKYAISTLKWKPLTENKRSFTLVANLTPSAIFVVGGPGRGDSVLSPKTPPQP